MPKQRSKVQKIYRPFNINIGIIVLVIVFIYVAFRLFSYLTEDDVSVYEVTAGTIDNDYEFKALAIRDEQVEYSPRSGYAYYFASDLQRVGTKSLVYMVDETGKIQEAFSSYTLSDSAADTSALNNAKDDIQLFISNYDPVSFDKVYSLRTSLNASLYRAKQDELLSVYESEIASASNSDTLSMVYAPVPGIVSFEIDGFEDVDLDNFTEAQVDGTDTLLSSGLDNTISEGDPAYKIITSDQWHLVIKVTDELLEELSEDSYIQIEFTDDNVTTWVEFYPLERNGVNYIVLTLDDSMSRYADSRYCNIRLLISESKGLKIPVSSITTKTFFTIPKVYFRQGGDSNDYGVVIRGEDQDNFVMPTIYYEDDEYFYVDSEDLNADDLIVTQGTSDTYKVGSRTDELVGVYNINKGYAVFKQIEIITMNNDFAIIKTGTSYGVALYDHIALYGDKIDEYDMI